LWGLGSSATELFHVAAGGSEDRYPLAARSAGLQLDAAGGLLVAAAGAVVRVAPDGSSTTLLTGGRLAGRTLVGAVEEAGGRLWLVDGEGRLYRYGADGTLVAAFAPLHAPKGMAVAAGGAPVVANGDGTVVRLGGAGHLPEVVAWGRYSEVAAAGDGTLLLGGTAGVDRLRLATRELSPFAPGVGRRGAVAVAPDGTVAVADEGGNRLRLYGPGGEPLEVLLGLVQPRGIAVDGTGRILVANGYPDEIDVVREDGRLEPFAALPGVRYLAPQPDGTLLASRAGQVAVLDGAGRVVQSLAAPNAKGLARGADGSVVVAATDPDAVVRLNPDGTRQTLASGLVHPTDVEADAAGNLYVSDAGAGVVHRLTPDGAISLAAQGLLYPSALAVSGGRLFVSYGAGRLASFGIGPSGSGSRVELTGATVSRFAAKGLAASGEGRLYAAVGHEDRLLRLVLPPALPPAPGTVVY
ncbi:MAG: hypothetical protein D6739_05645, partial [Nitrospirae bacterium]